MKTKTKLITIILISIGSLFLGTFSLANNELTIIGRIEGAGIFFEIKDSQYLNISLKSTEEIKVVLESIPRMISINLESSSTSSSTIFTFEGLELNKTYYRYQNSYKNGAVFVSDEKGSYIWTQDLSEPHHIWLQEIKSTVFLPEDCSKYGTWNETTKTCTLNQDLTQSVEIALVETQTDNITLDCNNHQISGSGAYGIFLNGFWKRETGGLKNVTVKNCKVSNFSYGIYSEFTVQSNLENNITQNNYVGIQLQNSPNNLVAGNTTEKNQTGIYISYSGNNTFNGNKIQLNKYAIIFTSYSPNNILRNNTISDNQYSIYLCFDGCWPPVDIHQDIDTSNTINGKPIYYLVNQTDKEISGEAGFVALIDSSNITVKNLTLSNNLWGILLFFTNNSKIENVQASQNYYGIYLFQSSNNILLNNQLLNNEIPAWLAESNGNIFRGNTIKSNNYPLHISSSPNNIFYHNNFINNQIDFCPSQILFWPGGEQGNIFDNGYPSGGNYWSDYTGIDEKSGPNQDQPGSDGIGDTPYNIYYKYYSFAWWECRRIGQDRYPFMKENGWEVSPAPTYNVAVILAETSDVPHESSSITAQPCKLLPQKTYSQGRSKEYFEDLLYCVADYHKENSFGKVNLNFEIYDNEGEWFKTDKNEQDYLNKEDEFVKDAINLATNTGIDFSDKDIVIVLHSGTSLQREKQKLNTQTWTPDNQPLGYPPYKIIIAEDDLVGGWSHEIGHILGALTTPENTIIPDLYKMGNVKKWDLMARGSWNDDGNNPPYMSSYTKEFLQWLNYDIYPQSAYGEYWINSLETSNYGDSVFRYNLSDDTQDESQKYYILEVRNRNLKTWDSSLPEEKALVLYRVDTKGYPEYGYASDGYPNNYHWKINIPYLDGILAPDGDSHLDMRNLVYITALSDEQTADVYRIKSKIEKINYNFFMDRFQGVILEPSSEFYSKIIQYLPFNSSLQQSDQTNLKQFSFQENKIGNTFERKSLTKTEKIILYLKHSKNLFTLRSIEFDYEYDKTFREQGGLIGTFSPERERITTIKEKSIFLLLIILSNLLIVWINKKIIPNWKSEKRKNAIKVILRIVQIISVIVFIIIFVLLVIVLTTFFTKASIDNSKISSNSDPKIEKVGYDFFEDRFQGIILEPSSLFYDKIIPYLSLSSSLQTVRTVKEEIEEIRGLLIYLLIFFLLLSFLLLFLERKLFLRWKSERKKKIAKIIVRIVWILTLITFLIFILVSFALYQEVKEYRKLNVKDFESSKVVAASSQIEPETLPDLDLQLYCDDGKHIGMNYETGEYEVQIPEAIVSGNNQDAPEWIFIPEGINNCNYFVSSYNNQKFLEENPEIAQEIEDTTDSYEIYARYIDNETAIYTSAIISEDIKPGVELEHRISDTYEIAIGPGTIIARVDFDPDTLNLKSKGK